MRPILIATLILTLAGCAAISSDSRQIKFDNTQRLYARTLEWSNYEGLAMFIKPAPENPPPDLERYKDYKITSYRPGRLQPSPDGKTVTRSANLQYVWTPRMSEKTITLVEIWTFSEEDGRWYLTSGLPKF